MVQTTSIFTTVLLWYNMKYKKNSMTVVYFYVKGDSHV